MLLGIGDEPMLYIQVHHMDVFYQTDRRVDNHQTAIEPSHTLDTPFELEVPDYQQYHSNDAHPLDTQSNPHSVHLP